jgi:hypothetical protein
MEHVRSMTEIKGQHKILFVKLKGRRQLGDIDIDASIAVEWILNAYPLQMLVELIRFRIASTGGLL